MTYEQFLSQPPSALFCGTGWAAKGQAIAVRQFDRVIQTRSPHEVLPCLQQIETQIQTGYWAFGFLAYEAAAAFALPVKPGPYQPPLLWFGLCRDNQLTVANLPGDIPSEAASSQFDLLTSREKFNRTIAALRDSIARGDTYQVNYTVRAEVMCPNSPLELFLHLQHVQPVPYAALIQTEHGAVLSLSPELFLQRKGRDLRTRPMKGTIRRGRYLEEDRIQAETLRRSAKDQAENVMIVDMARNDLGKICDYGRVETSRLFRIERYRTLFQMTSTVEGILRDGVMLGDIFQATFPAASITGAPKHKTMEIIRRHETHPRGVYCGSVGVLCPHGDFVFNVAIRTLWGRAGAYTLGLGGGIVWDSIAQSEYDEVKTKSNFLFTPSCRFTLFETLLLNETGAYVWRDSHLQRLKASALYWDFPFDEPQARRLLQGYASQVPAWPCVVKLELDSSGNWRLSNREYKAITSAIPVCLSSHQTHSSDPLLFHKTSRRDMYNQELARARQAGFFEVLFCNEAHNVTEGSISNLFYRRGRHWYTPPIADGLLPGVWRDNFLKQVGAKEQSISIDELIRQADEIIIGNSVIGPVHVAGICNR